MRQLLTPGKLPALEDTHIYPIIFANGTCREDNVEFVTTIGPAGEIIVDEQYKKWLRESPEVKALVSVMQECELFIEDECAQNYLLDRPYPKSLLPKIEQALAQCRDAVKGE